MKYSQKLKVDVLFRFFNDPDADRARIAKNMRLDLNAVIYIISDHFNSTEEPARELNPIRRGSMASYRNAAERLGTQEMLISFSSIGIVK